MNEDIVARLREGSRYRVLDGEAADEIERLRTEAARDFLERKRLESQVMEHAIDHARAQRAYNELRADRERLDWMIESLACVRWTHAPVAEAIVEWNDYGESRVHVNLRAAIDAVMAKA